MKRLLLSLVVSLFGISLLMTSTAQADVNDFTISSYDIHFTLGRDNEGRSTLKTVETITAEFSESDQNHGLERAIPTGYDGHPTNVRIDSVTDADGKEINYSADEDSSDNLVVRMGDADKYVHGSQTYIITYTQRDVTRFFANTDADEFYWDTNGTEWRVPIEKLSVTLKVDETLTGALSGNTYCYKGYVHDDEQCQIARDGNTFTTSAANLQEGENITIAVGFKPQTFAAYKESLLQILGRIWLISIGVVGAIGGAAMIWISVRWSRLARRSKEVGTIVPEYIPPKDASVTTSASVLASPRTVFTAQLLDLAVRHYLKIYEIDKKALIFGGKDYELEIVRDISDLRDEEREVLTDIFSGKTEVGSRLKLSTLRSNNSVYAKTLDNKKKLDALVRGAYKLREQNATQSAWFMRAGWVLLAVAIVFLNPAVLILAVITFVLAKILWPLTDKGLALYRYLEGLKMYIGVAETERLKLLQSPEGAEKVGVADPTNPAQLVKLYERVLPYAVLFGQEKEWNKRIGNLYESAGSQPSWYASNTAFNAAVFSSAMSSFSTSASYSAASSSSSGGSSGGGSSGGGGGGGGGGGW